MFISELFPKDSALISEIANSKYQNPDYNSRYSEEGNAIIAAAKKSGSYPSAEELERHDLVLQKNKDDAAFNEKMPAVYRSVLAKQHTNEANETTQLNFETLNITSSAELKEHFNNKFWTYIESGFIREWPSLGGRVRSLVKINESQEYDEILPIIDNLQNMGLTLNSKLAPGNKLSFLDLDVTFIARVIEVRGFTKPKTISHFEHEQNGKLRKIHFDDGTSYPQAQPATFNGRPIGYTLFFKGDGAARALTYLHTALPEQWEIDQSELITNENSNMKIHELEESIDNASVGNTPLRWVVVNLSTGEAKSYATSSVARQMATKRRMDTGNPHWDYMSIEDYETFKKRLARKKNKVNEVFADQGAGHAPEDSVAKKHRVSVTVVDPFFQGSLKGENEQERFVRVTANGMADAVQRAKQFYKNKGYKVIDANYVNPIYLNPRNDKSIEEATSPRGFMVAINDNEAREHFLDYLFDHTGDGHMVNDVRNMLVRFHYPMKNRAGTIAAAVKGGAMQDDAEDAYNAIAFEYDGKWE